MVLDTNTLVAVISALVSIPTTVIVFFLSQNYLQAKNRSRLVKRISRQIIIFSSSQDMSSYLEAKLPTVSNVNPFQKLRVWTYAKYLAGVNLLKVILLAVIFLLISSVATLLAKSPLSTLIYWLIAPFLILALCTLGFKYVNVKIDKWNPYRPFKYAFELYQRDYFWLSVLIVLAYLGGSLVPNFQYLLSGQLYVLTTLFPFLYIFGVVYVLPGLFEYSKWISKIEIPEDTISNLFDFLRRNYTDRILIPVITVDVGGKELLHGKIQGIGKDVLIIDNYYLNWESILYFKLE